MRKSTLLLIITFLLTLSTVSDAQIFKRVLNRATDKIAQRAEDKIVEGISNEIANRAMRPVDDWFNELFKKQYEETYGEPYDESKYENDEERTAAMQAMMGNLFGSVEIADEYAFSHVMEIETTDYGEKKPHAVKMYISNEKGILGMEQEDEEHSLIVWDFDNDVMVLFNNKEKTAMGVPSFMKMAATMGADNAIEENMNEKNYKFEKTKKTKKILGYECQGYKLESDDEKGEFYMTDQLGFGWKDSYGKMLKDLAPNYYGKTEIFASDMMMMKSEMKRNKDKKKSKWETKKVDDSGYTIETSGYKVTNAMQEAQKQD